MLTKDKIIDECIEVLNRKEVKHEFKKMMSPLIELILKDIYPYIYLSVIFVVCYLSITSSYLRPCNHLLAEYLADFCSG